MSFLELNHVSKAYHTHRVLEDLNLTLEAGQIVGLLSPNGLGKTTLLKLIAGLEHPNYGEIRIDGQTPGEGTAVFTAYLPDTSFIHKDESAEEYAELFRVFYSDFRPLKFRELLERFQILPDTPMSQLSKGEQEKVSLALVLARQARLYLLDEPLGGVDPLAREELLRYIVENYDPQSLMIISTHLIDDVEQYLDSAVFLGNNSVVLQGSCDDLRATYQRSLRDLFREVYYR